MKMYRPQVLVSYDDQGAYQHPDHVQAPAWPRRRPPTRPASRPRSTCRPCAAVPPGGRSGRPCASWARTSPLRREDPERVRRALESEERITTTVDIRSVLSRKREALLTHGSQINDSWFSKLPQNISEEAFGYEYFIRIADATGTPAPETDLFAGLRTGELPAW